MITTDHLTKLYPNGRGGVPCLGSGVPCLGSGVSDSGSRVSYLGSRKEK